MKSMVEVAYNTLVWIWQTVYTSDRCFNLCVRHYFISDDNRKDTYNKAKCN